ncbi:eukaryotic translation initiation factor 3 subunit E-B-like isoform X2 [Stegodyphus dumicola]|uniref:eukaryotic translation initiation factor 3 subunit E-B-like isoform X2 n=1 Tax=Stegodyphus dumicola TaxID=202533 RepID=UPI0015A8E6FB|nr:eukaryotic translation initiation factor 3 subunit E-B-like isoform X2 [Stegodyphus dumicola]
MAQWDLTSKISVYLDRHLVFPLLEFLSVKQVYDERELLLGKLEIVKNTRMIDYAIDIFKLLYPNEKIPEELLEKRGKVVSELKVYQEETEHIRQVFQSQVVQKQIESTRDGRMLLDFLVKNYDFNIECMDFVYIFAKSQYECGNYLSATEYLYLYRLLVPSTDKNYLNGMWGKLASEILMQNWDTALDDLNRLKEFIDSNPFGSALVALQQRTWLIHWSLFVFFNHAKGQDLIIDTFLFQQQYLNAIQTICPHILRYLTAAVITNKQRPNVMKELVKVIQQESYQYRDPITEFVECLYVNFDFDGAQQKLRECEQVLAYDFFLVSCLESFIENARLVIFETFCCIHQCLSIKMLAEKLNMDPDHAEKWIVNLIRNARLDAKIDSQLGHVVMGTKKLSPYQQLIEKTKVLSFRAQLLASNVEKKVAANHPERTPYWAAPEF